MAAVPELSASVGHVDAHSEPCPEPVAGLSSNAATWGANGAIQLDAEGFPDPSLCVQRFVSFHGVIRMKVGHSPDSRSMPNSRLSLSIKARYRELDFCAEANLHEKPGRDAQPHGQGDVGVLNLFQRTDEPEAFGMPLPLQRKAKLVRQPFSPA